MAQAFTSRRQCVLRQEQRKSVKMYKIAQILNDANDDSIQWINHYKIQFNWNIVQSRRVFLVFFVFLLFPNWFFFFWIFLQITFRRPEEIFFKIFEVCSFEFLAFNHFYCFSLFSFYLWSAVCGWIRVCGCSNADHDPSKCFVAVCSNFCWFFAQISLHSGALRLLDAPKIKNGERFSPTRQVFI